MVKITEPERCEGDPNTAQKDEKNKGENESNVPSKHRSWNIIIIKRAIHVWTMAMKTLIMITVAA